MLDTLDERFRRLVMARGLHPPRMDERVIELIPCCVLALLGAQHTKGGRLEACFSSVCGMPISLSLCTHKRQGTHAHSIGNECVKH